MISATGGWVADVRFAGLSAAVAVLCVAFALLPPGLNFSASASGSEIERGALGLVQWPVLFLFGGLLLLRRWRLALASLRWLNFALPLLLGWFLASTLWSAAPAETARRATRLIALALCAWAYVLTCWQPGRFWRHARYTLGLVAAASIVVAILLPEIGTHAPSSPEAGKWQGVTSNKNILGPAAGIGLILWLHAWACREITLHRALPWLALCTVALLGARSSTSTLTAAMGVLLVLVLLRPPLDLRGRRLPLLVLLLLVAVIPAYMWVILDGTLAAPDLVAPIAEVFGKDATLSGRNEIWSYLLAEIPRHPWLGVGHGAYWLGEWSLSDLAVRELYWVPNQGHNFYLDLVNETGVIGAAFFLLFVMGHLRATLHVARLDWPLAVLNGVLLLMFLVQGITETTMMRAITFPTVLMCFASFDLSRRLFEAELQRWR